MKVLSFKASKLAVLPEITVSILVEYLFCFFGLSYLERMENTKQNFQMEEKAPKNIGVVCCISSNLSNLRQKIHAGVGDTTSLVILKFLKYVLLVNYVFYLVFVCYLSRKLLKN